MRKTTLDNDDINYLEELVICFMHDRKSFTSLDITNHAKDAGYWVRNNWVAEWLRSNVIAIAHDHVYLYNQTLIDVDSKLEGMTLAYLYHHMNRDPDEYLDRDQNPQSIVPRTRTRRVYVGNTNAPQSGTFVGTSQTDPGDFTTQDGGTHNPGRDKKGRFTSNNSPSHWRGQRRDGKGRFI